MKSCLAGITILDLSRYQAGPYGTMILAALYHRTQTCQGQEIDISMLDCQVSISAFAPQIYLASGEIPVPRGSADHLVGACLTVKTREGRYLFVCALQDNQFQGLCRAMGREELVTDPRFSSLASRRDHREAINRILEEAFLEKTTDEWLALLGRESVPCGPVNTVDRVVTDPQVLARKMVVEVDHPTQGRFPVIGNPIKCLAMEEAQIQSPPMLGQHTEEVLKRLLGYSEEAIRELRRAGIV